MKKHDSYKNQDQERKFKRKVNHMSSFVGMPMWNGRKPSLSEIREYDRRILEQQAKNFEPRRTSLLKRVFRMVFKSVSVTYGKVTKLGGKKMQKKEPIIIGPECCM